PRDFAALDRGSSVQVPAGTAVRYVRDAGWAEVASGALRAGSDPAGEAVTAGDPAFVTDGDWLVATEDAVVAGRGTADLLADGTLWPALVAHQTRVLYAVDRLIERREQREMLLLEHRHDQDRRVLRRALQGFSTVLDDSALQAALAEAALGPPALAAMSLVAGQLGLTVVAPRAAGGVGRAVNPVEAIALASRLRTRPVRLSDRWWRRDAGPLVGYRHDDSPVALVPGPRGYQVVDPQAGRVQQVTAEVAAELSPRATMLYRPLPPGLRRGRELLRFGLADCRRDLATLAWSSMTVSLLGLLVPILTGTILGTFVPRGERQLIVEGCILVIASAFVAAAFASVQNLAVLRLEGRVDSTIQAAVWDHLLALPLRFFAAHSTGELSTGALAVNAVREALTGVATTATLALMTGLFNLVLAFFYSVPLALLVTGLVLVALGVCFVAGVYEVRVQRQIFALEKELSSKVFQLLTGLPKLRVAGAEDRGFAHWAGDFAKSRGLSLRARRIQNFITSFNAGFVLVASLTIFAVVGEVVHLPTGAFLSFFAAFTLLLAATLQFTGVAITVLSIVPMFSNLAPILACEREVGEEKSNAGELSGEITFNHVSFRYLEDGPPVLDDVSFAVRPGEFLAVVGPTGCGKSTLVRLLLGFEEPTAGSVLYDGQDLAQLDVVSVRRQCGVVLQNGSLLAGDIKTNIIGNSTYTLEDAWEAARMSGFDKDVEGMPMGMYTVVSEGASTLSGGQRQRLMIARALVSRPRILIMDEATSALDNPTQAQVAESTRALHATRIVIAHRLSTIRWADRILVLDGGRIVQQGSFDELAADEQGLFARLVRRQLG
ncbi:MAG: NHLP bacteriocin export ABC transporter permease/ATPase subunit, partial [Mycobacteriales bacterium]